MPNFKKIRRDRKVRVPRTLEKRTINGITEYRRNIINGITEYRENIINGITEYRKNIMPRFLYSRLVDEANVTNIDDTSHATDLLNLLLAYFGYWFKIPDKLFAKGSRNIIRMRLYVLALVDPIYAAKVVIREWSAELTATTARNRQRFWQDDELLSCIYEAWSSVATQLLLSVFKEYPGVNKYISNAILLLEEDLRRQQAIYALIGMPGIARGSGGREKFSSNCLVRAACLRGGLGERISFPTTVAMSYAVFGGRWFVEPGILDIVAEETAEVLLSSNILNGIGSPVGSKAWKLLVEECTRILENTNTSVEYVIRHYYPSMDHPLGQKATAIVGSKPPSSTAEIRLVLCGGPEIWDCKVVTPHIKQRKVPESKGYFTNNGTYYCEIKQDSVEEQMPDNLAVNIVLNKTGPIDVKFSKKKTR